MSGLTKEARHRYFSVLEVLSYIELVADHGYADADPSEGGAQQVGPMLRAVQHCNLDPSQHLHMGDTRVDANIFTGGAISDAGSRHSILRQGTLRRDVRHVATISHIQ